MINAAVIGAGSMGANHARVYARMEEADLVAVADVQFELAQRVAGTYRSNAYTDYRDMLEKEEVDVVTVAVPSCLHHPVAEAVIHAGCHVFIEKPMARSVEECRHLIQAAASRGVKLTVGHVERFNPALLALKKKLLGGQLGRVFQVHARRVGPFPPRIEDVGVVFDLATHEVNIMEYLLDSQVENLYAETEQEIHAYHEDLLTGLLKFRNGAVGVLDINWLTPTKIRELSIIGERGMFLLNYLTQDLRFYENNMANGSWDGDRLAALMGVSEGTMIKFDIRRQEPLMLELKAWVQAVAEDRPVAISGEEGMRAVYLAEKLVESGRIHQVLTLVG